MFSDLSITLTKTLSKSEKKDQGIYFTPRSIAQQLLDKALLYNSTSSSNLNILEPSCGSGEFLSLIIEQQPSFSITAIEKNSTIYQSVITEEKFQNINIQIINQDFLQYTNAANYDLVIGNPPFFVIFKSNVPSKYKQFTTGRPNIFCLFIIHAITLLKKGGICAFVVPKSFLNSSYYSSVRAEIKINCDICLLEDYSHLNDFLETQQSTFGLIIRKRDTKTIFEDDDYSLLVNGEYIFTPYASKLASLFKGACTLKQLGLAVKTGSIVWNEHKDILSTNSEDTVLLYNTNLTATNDIKLTTFSNKTKFQYIQKDGMTRPVIVVNRGYGNAKYAFKYAVASVKNLGQPFLVENHLNVIYSTNECLPEEELLELYHKVLQSFQQEKTQQFINLYFGNNGLSKTELENVLPIYI